MFLLSSCEDSFDVTLTGGIQEGLIMEKLHCAGFKTEDVEVYDNYVVVEGDMAISLDKLLQLSEKPLAVDKGSESAKTDSWAVDAGADVNITAYQIFQYYIQPSMANLPGGNDWVTAIQTATEQWENISGCRVNFSQTFSASNADIVFYPVKGTYFNGTSYVNDPNVSVPDFPNLPNCAKDMKCGFSKARASYPINQDIGSWVAIAGCSLTTPFPTLTQKTNIVAHEIGHTLGFRHADFGCAGNGEPTYDTQCPEYPAWGANHLWGTSTCDETSLMAANDDNSFNDNDRKAARMLYPEGTPPSITGVSKLVCVSPPNCHAWRIYVSNPLPWYRLKVRLKRLSTNTFIIGNEVLGNQSSITFTSTALTPGNYQFQVMGIDYSGYRYSYSNYFAVTVP